MDHSKPVNGTAISSVHVPCTTLNSLALTGLSRDAIGSQRVASCSSGSGEAITFRVCVGAWGCGGVSKCIHIYKTLNNDT